MKNIIVMLFAIIAVCASASETLKVSGTKAKEVTDALIGVGATINRETGDSYWKVSKLSCEYTPRGFIWSQCTLTDSNNGVELSAFTGKALNLFSALSKAGARVIDRGGLIESSEVTAKSVTCMKSSDAGVSPVPYYCEINQ